MHNIGSTAAAERQHTVPLTTHLTIEPIHTTVRKVIITQVSTTGSTRSS